MGCAPWRWRWRPQCMGTSRAFLPASVEQFLELRVTLLNVIFAALFVLAWISCCSALGLYRQEHQSVLRALKRALQGCAVHDGCAGALLFHFAHGWSNTADCGDFLHYLVDLRRPCA